MCVIAVKIKGADFVPLANIQQCIKRNPDGFSMAWNCNGKVEAFRTMDA